MALNNFYLRSLAVSYLCVTSDIVFGANWDFTPSILVGQRYTDNIFLEPDDIKSSESISEVIPGIRITGESQALNLLFDYRPQAIYYREQDEFNDIYHNLDSLANIVFADNLFYLDAVAQINQQPTSRSSSLPPDDNITISSDRTQVTTTSISPYFKRNFANDYEGLIRYRQSRAVYDDSTLANNKDRQFIVQFNTLSSRQRTLEWKALYDKRKNEFDDGFEWEREHSGAEIGFRLSSTFTLLTNGGYESNEYRPANVKDSGSYWLAGFRWQPGTRTSLTMRVGDRFFGRTGQFELSHSSRRWSILMTYDDSFTNSSEGYLNTQDGEDNGQVTPTVVAGVFLERKAEINLNRSYSKTVFNIRLYDIDRELQLSTDTETITGAELKWDWSITQKSLFNILLRKQNVQPLGIVREDKDSTIELGYGYRIGRNGSVNISYLNQKRSSSNALSNYEQNMYILNYVYELD